MDSKIILNESLSLREKAFRLDVSHVTVRNRILRLHNGKHGRPTKFTSEEETQIEDLLLRCSEIGVPLSKRLLTKVVLAVGRDKGLETEKNVLTCKWQKGFLKRHARISLRATFANNRKKARQWSMERCEKWIDVLSDLDRQSYFEDPQGIWNLDETACSLAEVYDKVYTAKGAREVDSYFDGDEKERLTLLPCGNAAGRILRPLVLYDGKLHLSSRFEGTDDACLIGVNASGYMDNEVFTAYVKQELLPKMAARKNVIFLDGHSSHANNLSFIKTCMDSGKDIKIVVFPAGQTSRLQPFDKSVFGGFKKKWRDHLRDLHTSLFYEPLNRNNFPAHLMSLWSSFNFSQTLQDGFRKTGLFPFLPEVIRQTVKPVGQLSVETSFSSTLSLQKRRLQDVLQEMNIPNQSISRLVDQEVRETCGDSVAYDIAKSFHRALMDSNPKKQKKPKDNRLAQDVGLVISSAVVVRALEEKEAEKARKRVPRKRSQKQVEKEAQK